MKKALFKLIFLSEILTTILMTRSFAFEAIEATADYPLVMGSMGQNFTSNAGAGVAFYFDRLLDPAIANFISIDYKSLTIEADKTSSFRIIPILVGLEAQGKVFEDFFTTFGLGLGGALGWMNVTNPTVYSFNQYFMAQLRPGLEYVVAEGFSMVGRSAVNFMFGKSQMTYAVFSLGLKYKL